ncbi:MAG: cytochrome c oxidase assembly protein [Chloroflexi bacterium]|nr:MAG: cytochrome c oxidase assembly protein [Chloroflexota bacterium]
MNPILKAALLSWGWRIDVIIVLALAGTIYTRGWWVLRRRTAQVRNWSKRRPGLFRRQLAVPEHLVLYWLGIFFIGLALLSPIDVLGEQLFLMHMVQHLLLVMVAPPLLLLANPMAVMLWGLPGKGRYVAGGVVGRLLHRDSATRRRIRQVTQPGIVWMLWAVMVFGWHDPGAYNAALRSELVHDVEHLTFFVAGMLFWWHVTGAGPRIHPGFSQVGRIAFTLAAIPPNMLTGVVLAFARAPVYSYYESVPRLWGISVMTDQQLGGIIMWIPGSMMYLIAALILIAGLLHEEERKPVMSETQWGSDETMRAPGGDL